MWIESYSKLATTKEAEATARAPITKHESVKAKQLQEQASATANTASEQSDETGYHGVDDESTTKSTMEQR